MSDVVSVSPTRLATYATCPRQYEYSYVQDVSSPDETKLYLNQGKAYHEMIERVCDAAARDDDPAVIYERAMDVFGDTWAKHIDPDDYASKAHQEYQRRETLAGLKSFFDPEDGDGIEHAQHSVTTEKRIQCERDGIGLHGYTDNVLRDGDTLHLIDYKRNVRGVLGSWSADRLEEHLNEEAHELNASRTRSRPLRTRKASKTRHCTNRGCPFASASTDCCTRRKHRARRTATP
ncbi:PD-(D/E)XK nuclease family protein [Halomicroarcula sp. GCM10025710]